MKMRMKTYQKKSRACILYREELEQIVTIMSQDGTVSLEARNFSFEIGEIENLPIQVLHHLEIRSQNISVWLLSFTCRVTSDTDDPKVWGMCGQVSDILDHSRRLLGFAGFISILMMLGLATLLDLLPLSKPVHYSLMVVMAGAMWANAFGIFYTFRRSSTIILKRRKDAPGFWSKYREDFAKQAVTALISGLVGGGIGFGFGRLNAAVTPTPSGQPVVQATTQPTTQK